MCSRTDPSVHGDARGGFVLMEAVVALAIIGTVAVALLAATAMQVRSAERATRLLAAQALAEERLAVVRGLGWQQLLAPPDSLERGVFAPPFEDYAWRIEIEPVREEYDLFSVGVEVTAGEHAFRLSTLLHEPQPQLGVEAAPAQGGAGSR